MKPLKDDDVELLRLAFRDVTPLKGRGIGHRAEKAPVEKAARKKAPAKAPPLVLPVQKPSATKAPLPDLSAGTAAGVDQATVRKLKRGKMDLAGRLDLHGYTQDQAYSALSHFLAAMQGSSSRTVLVITGKSGVLRQEVPRWLNLPPNRARILSFAQARIGDGGDGALYVLVRKAAKS